MADTLLKVRTIVAQQLCLELSQVQEDSVFSSDLGADSLDVVELVMALEEGFNIEISDEAAVNIATVKDACEFIDAEIN